MPIRILSPSLAISSGQTKTQALPVGDVESGRFYIPSSFDGATVSFETAENDNGTFGTAKDENNQTIRVTVSTSGWYLIPWKVLEGAAALKIVSASSETGDRTILTSLKTKPGS